MCIYEKVLWFWWDFMLYIRCAIAVVFDLVTEMWKFNGNYDQLKRRIFALTAQRRIYSRNTFKCLRHGLPHNKHVEDTSHGKLMFYCFTKQTVCQVIFNTSTFVHWKANYFWTWMVSLSANVRLNVCVSARARVYVFVWMCVYVYVCVCMNESTYWFQWYAKTIYSTARCTCYSQIRKFVSILYAI